MNYILFIRITLTLIFAIIIVYIISFFYSGHSFSFTEMDIEITAQVGDFFGGVIGPVLSLLGILFVVQTIGLQRDQIQLQNKQLEEQIKVNEQEQIDKINEFIEIQYQVFFNDVKKFNLTTKILEDFMGEINNPGINIVKLEELVVTRHQELERFFRLGYYYYKPIKDKVNLNKVLTEKSKIGLRFAAISRINYEILNTCAANFQIFETAVSKFKDNGIKNLGFYGAYDILSRIYTDMNER